MKKLYEAPEMEVIRFTAQDVITASMETGGNPSQGGADSEDLD